MIPFVATGKEDAFMKRTKLKSLREHHGLSQYEVAREANLTRSYYGLIENGTRNPTLPKAQKIAQVLHVELDEAFPDEVFFAGKCYTSNIN